VRERVFGGAAAGGLGFGFFCACTYFFCAFLKNRQNKLYFSVSVDFFRVCIVTHRKIIQFFCGFSYFSVGIFWNRQKNRNFSVRTEKNAQKNLSPTEKSEIPVVSELEWKLN
jgi:hypothetical protein